MVADGWFSVRDEPERTVPIAALMKTWRTVGNALPGLPQDEMEVTRTYGPENIQALPDGEGRVQLYPTYAYSVHVAGVEVDIETGVVCLTSLAAVHDCGVVINEDLVTAQLHGAVAMGVGNALTEEERYDAEGRPLASSFKTYMFPRNKDIPRIRTGSLVSPSPYTILGTKGAGESGVGGAAAAIASAVKDALGIPQAPTSLPLTPESVLDLVDAAKNEAKKVAAP